MFDPHVLVEFSRIFYFVCSNCYSSNFVVCSFNLLHILFSIYPQSGVVLLQKHLDEPGIGIIDAELRTESECLALLYPTAVITIDITHLTTLLKLSVYKLAKGE